MPNISTIAPYQPFISTLAQYIKKHYGDTPHLKVLLPTARACGALKDALFALSGNDAMILPQIMPMGEVEEEALMLLSHQVMATVDLPQVISSSKQRLLLTKLVNMWQKASNSDEAMSMAQSANMAVELSSFLADIQRQQLQVESLETLVPEELATHWQVTLTFLKILIDTWPQILKEENLTDPAQYRNILLKLQCDIWQKEGSKTPIIAAGSTGSIPAVAQLLTTIASLENGLVVLPGLDPHMTDEVWQQLGQSHPQYGLKQLLMLMDVSYQDVSTLEVAQENDATDRSYLSSMVMLPASCSHIWQQLDHDKLKAEHVHGVSYIEAEHITQEAQMVALLMRKALDEPNKTAALITHERVLARRVSTILKRWGIDIDDSAGIVLSATQPALFMRLLIQVMQTKVAIGPLLALLKHPLAAMGQDPVLFRQHVYKLEKKVLRGVTVTDGFNGIKNLLRDQDEPELLLFVDNLHKILDSFVSCAYEKQIPLKIVILKHIKTACALAQSNDQDGMQRLFGTDSGEQLLVLIQDALSAADNLQAMRATDYIGIFNALIAGKVYRPRYGKHPRLSILSPIEARMLPFDTVILGGMNEGVWPASLDADPWMSRSMRQAFGLPMPERKIGLSAHDFAQMLCMPDVVITRSRKVSGSQTIACRWLATMQIILRKAGLENALIYEYDLEAWLVKLNGSGKDALYLAPPAPCPPVHARPTSLPVTAIGNWMRDPYSIYAKYILGLRKLDPIEHMPDIRHFGMMVHEALDWYAKHQQGDIDQLLYYGKSLLAKLTLHPITEAFWWSRFDYIARWFVEVDAPRQAKFDATFTEITGAYELEGFTLKATADRVDVIGQQCEIIDYKTGSIPSKKDVKLGISPQMPLEGLIAKYGGFNDKQLEASHMAFWKISGNKETGKETNLGKQDILATLIEEAEAGLKQLVATFNDSNTPYMAIPNPDIAPIFNDYEHLERVKEWMG